jgi:hypothetical protein
VANSLDEMQQQLLNQSLNLTMNAGYASSNNNSNNLSIVVDESAQRRRQFNSNHALGGTSS